MAALLFACAACKYHPGAKLELDASSGFCDPHDPTLVACYELEGSSEDHSANHLPTTQTNVTFGPGKVGLAMQLDATSAINVSESSALDTPTITIEAWVSPAQLPALDQRAGIVDCQGQWGLFLQGTGELRCLGLDVAAKVPVGAWTHVACTYDQLTARLYLDGVVIGELAKTDPLPSTGTQGFSIGADNPPGSGSPWIGSIDQVRVFDVGRSAAEICADADAEATCP